MFHLIRLESKKTNLGWFVKGAILANIFILGFLCIIPAIEESDGGEMLKDVTGFFTISGACVRGVFIVFAAVLISKMIIDEFKNRTVLIMFSYPINRKKILSAKLILIVWMTFIAMTISHTLVISGFIGLNHIFHLTPAMNLTLSDFLAELIKVIMFGFTSSVAALIPLYFGMRKYSTPATIISSLLIVSVTCQSIGPNFSLANIIYIPLALAIIALGIVVLAIRNINHIDLD
ncbi:ABC transporter permease [Bacillus sp. BRMEA1]|uniref:ABC transporter permease n=1 Tax=Neobacillus endophyticus TaxID=2738405 RepID=UPI0015673F6A|nr:ABC transporter permease [Neobacillus endophyticus]NRD78129.1 ABC transporter permease [Neobacillus endophyticus]